MKYQKGNTILTIIILVAVVLFLYSFLSKDKYMGFYYPDRNNLSNDIQSDISFSSFESCRAWVNSQILKYNKNNQDYDYECGKNCKLDGGKPYVCEETLE